ncbi:MAG: ABC transporter ATP-binding protein [Calditrichia bacterium]
MITIRNLCKAYGKLSVFEDLNAEMRPGEVTAILGHNGCGKTTLIKSLLGLVRPNRGEMTVNGHHVNSNPDYRSQIGYMPQIARYPDNLSVAEVVSLIRNIRSESSYDLTLWQRFMLAGEEAKPVHTLSGGTRQKLSAALAFMFKPNVLILDEPTAGLDPLAAGILKEHIAAYRAQGATVLLTSHVMSDIEELADKLIYLNEGKIIYSGELSTMIELTGEERLERAVANLMAGEN